MVPEQVTPLKMDESLYEEITVREDILKPKCLSDSHDDTKTTRDKSRGKQSEAGKTDGAMNDNRTKENDYTTLNSSDSFDIYEVIPAEREDQKTPEPPLSRTSSISSNEEQQSVRSYQTAHKSRTYSSCSSGSESDEGVQQALRKRGLSCPTPDISSTQYAEIVSGTKITEYKPSRPTRESDNPILRLEFASSSKSSDKCLGQNKTESDFERSNSLTSRRIEPVYENTPTATPNNSPKLSPNQSPCCNAHNQSGRLYENVDFPFMTESDCESRRSSISIERQSLSSEGSSRESEAISTAYENIPCEERPRTRSKPLDIVYSDLDFSEHNNRRKIERCVSVPVGVKLTPPRSSPVTNSLPPFVKTRPLPPQRKTTVTARPKSMIVCNSSNVHLGFHIAKFVGKVVVHRANDQVLQTAIQDLLRKTNEGDTKFHSVNIEVNNELVRISTNCSPWEVILSCEIDQIGLVSLYEQDTSVVGLISSLPHQEAICYALRSAEAPTILRAIKNVFNSPEPRLKSFRLASSSHLGPENWLEDSIEVQTFNGVIYLGSHKIKKSLLSVKDSIQDILNKSNAKDFKTVSLKVHCNEIHILECDGQTPLDKHMVPWVVSMGVFETDPRVFGYIVTEARQGKKTLMYCHAFRCGRVTSAASVTEALRMASQATYSARKDSIGSSRSRRGSQVSRASTLSLSSISSDNENEEDKDDKTPVDKIQKEANKSRRIRDLPVFRKLSRKESSKNCPTFKSHISDASGRNNSNSSVEDFVVIPTEIVEEKVFNFEAMYLCSTVVNPPLRPKHVRECAKQFRKQNDKLMKRLGKTQTTNEVKMDVGADGVAMYDKFRPENGQRFFPFSDINVIKSHPDYPEYFSFSTVVTGDTKHKCHLFKQSDNYPCGDIITAFESFM